ncbi:uncharacterized protein B0H18DRAFT_955043 [Fomitopsis serialis]|uniref:uncharacterized protein n=1 Tax=Fomitopsis serialis TaxID=139415 RepID=UPI002008C8B0|nr:uncharacterized protein B0H18DRAFT_955043 [Neoantrodia serialis]KAH9925515.1 hypothetical protein B0H18DRAFT_955043 [Neoantrodia serialis]
MAGPTAQALTSDDVLIVNTSPLDLQAVQHCEPALTMSAPSTSTLLSTATTTFSSLTTSQAATTTARSLVKGPLTTLRTAQDRRLLPLLGFVFHPGPLHSTLPSPLSDLATSIRIFGTLATRNPAAGPGFARHACKSSAEQQGHAEHQEHGARRTEEEMQKEREGEEEERGRAGRTSTEAQNRRYTLVGRPAPPPPLLVPAPADVLTSMKLIVRTAGHNVVPGITVVPAVVHGNMADTHSSMRMSLFLLDVCVADENTDVSGVLEEVPGLLFDLLHATKGYPMMVHQVHTSPAAAPTLEGNTTNVQFVTEQQQSDCACCSHFMRWPSPHAVDMPGSSFDAFTTVCSRNAHDECTPVPAIPRGNMSGAHHCTSDMPYLCDPSHNRQSTSNSSFSSIGPSAAQKYFKYLTQLVFFVLCAVLSPDPHYDAPLTAGQRAACQAFADSLVTSGKTELAFRTL